MARQQDPPKIDPRFFSLLQKEAALAVNPRDTPPAVASTTDTAGSTQRYEQRFRNVNTPIHIQNQVKARDKKLANEGRRTVSAEQNRKERTSIDAANQAKILKPMLERDRERVTYINPGNEVPITRERGNESTGMTARGAVQQRDVPNYDRAIEMLKWAQNTPGEQTPATVQFLQGLQSTDKRGAIPFYHVAGMFAPHGPSVEDQAAQGSDVLRGQGRLPSESQTALGTAQDILSRARQGGSPGMSYTAGAITPTAIAMGGESLALEPVVSRLFHGSALAQLAGGTGRGLAEAAPRVLEGIMPRISRTLAPILERNAPKAAEFATEQGVHHLPAKAAETMLHGSQHTAPVLTADEIARAMQMYGLAGAR